MKTCGVDINMFYLFIFAIIIAGLKNFTWIDEQWAKFEH